MGEVEDGDIKEDEKRILLKTCSIKNITNKLYYFSTTETGCQINVSNTTIINNSNVIFDATESTTINGPFEVIKGSTLEIK